VYHAPATGTESRGDRAPAVTMIGWHGTALGCRRRGLCLCAAKCELKMVSTFKRLVRVRAI